MPKRKRSSERDINYYRKKIKKLEQKIRDHQASESTSVSEPEEIMVLQDEEFKADTPALRPDDWLLDWPEDEPPEPQPGPSTDPEPRPVTEPVPTPLITELDTEILEILGDDPNKSDRYGPEIHNELANRLLHIAKEGLNKENRKDLISKYPLPMNCAQLDAPKINLEIKAAIGDTAIKRDKGIETKQKQMSSAIACLTEVINSQLISHTKNNELLQKLMDLGRILCDLQHADSITRRNFILFALKNDLKEHIKSTKIDTLLFGENLADILKSAKAVNKSGVELKADFNNKAINELPANRGAGSRPLNRRAPQARRPPAGPASAPRSREPAASRGHYPQPATQVQPSRAHASRTSSRGHQATHPRRRY